EVQVTWSVAYGPGCVDALFALPSALDPARFWIPGGSPLRFSESIMSNDPMRMRREQKLTSLLRSHLQANLPSYMLPTSFVFLNSLPLTLSGKVNRKALPAPGVARGATFESYVGPRNPKELRLAKIWEEVLGIERVGVHDDFFEIGGDSLLTVQVANRATEEGFPLTPTTI